ncbi:MAG: GNAT family N-acetyltransferase [Acidimicrobiia bacterium]|nr:MAG: GNAT family N-acetyltransferase [Acidimicrobiia bacterium]
MAITTRPITEDEVLVFRERVNAAFGGDVAEEDRGSERFLATLPLARTVAAFDADQMVGTLGTYEFEVTVPGGAQIAMFGTTVVTTQPTHRRQGVLRAMMRDHLDDAAGMQAPLVGLWASESTIYGRFGFGRATSRDSIEAPKHTVTVSGTDAGAVRAIQADQVTGLFAPIYNEVWQSRPGMLSRTPEWWTHKVLHDPPHHREGASAKRFVVYEADGVAEGYAIYVQKSDWTEFDANGQIRVTEVITTTGRAHTGLWSFLTNVDLFPRIRYWNLPIDDPLWWKLAEPRRVERKRADALWIRIIDVPAALGVRGYESDGTIRIGVDDPFRPATSGVYELSVSDGLGSCVRADGSADLNLGIDGLGALYLGGGNALSLAAAGLIDGAPGHVALLHRLFRTDVAPWCEEVF